MKIKRNNGDNLGAGTKRHVDIEVRLICVGIPAVVFNFMYVEDNIYDRIYSVVKLCVTLFNDDESTAALKGKCNIELIRMREEAALTSVKGLL
jgi:hypothetical protein